MNRKALKPNHFKWARDVECVPYIADQWWTMLICSGKCIPLVWLGRACRSAAVRSAIIWGICQAIENCYDGNIINGRDWLEFIECHSCWAIIDYAVSQHDPGKCCARQHKKRHTICASFNRFHLDTLAENRKWRVKSDGAKKMSAFRNLHGARVFLSSLGKMHRHLC